MSAPVTSEPSAAELFAEPPLAEWPEVVERNRSAIASWEFEVAGRPVAEVRRQARSELLELAERFSAKLPVEVRPRRGVDEPIVLSGHQPEIYHPGVWVKCFALERLVERIGGTGIDLEVDTDGFEWVGVTYPEAGPPPRRGRSALALGGDAACFACASAPDQAAITRFAEEVEAGIGALGSPEIAARFARFRTALSKGAQSAGDVGEAITRARRIYESDAGTRYLELPMTHLARGQAFTAFVAHIASRAELFATAYNDELAAYRREHKTRSAAQPVPDLKRDGAATELPFWSLADGRRTAVWALAGPDGVSLTAEGRTLAVLPTSDTTAASILAASDVVLVPKALTLTMFVRLICGDLLIHGRGGARYDRVTEGVVRRFFGIELPAHVVASATMRLPLRVTHVTDEDVSAATERLNRLTHHPDEWLADAHLDDASAKEVALGLVRRKAQLVSDIGRPGADRKSLGIEIKAVNAQLAAVLEPVRLELEAELTRLSELRAAVEIIEDRTYPFCFFDPLEVAALVR